MIKRKIVTTLLERLAQFPAVALLGPRQVGKTTLALSITSQIPSVYLDLESPQDINKLSDPLGYFKMHQDKLIILDEVQRMPDLFQLLRGVIDEGKREGLRSKRFLLLGSASIELLKQTGESLAGRIAYLELTGLTYDEVEPDEMNKLWVRGGFPDSFLAPSESQSYIWRESFIKTYLERDIPLLGPRIPAETLRRFWTMLCHNQGGLHNAAQLARGLAVDGKTIARYLDLLVDLLLLRRLPPWHNNVGKRLVKSPKIFVRDSGLLHTLLNIFNLETLLSHPIIGMSWEGYIIENILTATSNNVQVSFYRTAAGAEIDLLLEFSTQQLWAVEIKRGSVPKIEKGFHIACDDVKPTKCFVIYAGNERYSLQHSVEAIGLLDFLNELKPLL